MTPSKFGLKAVWLLSICCFAMELKTRRVHLAACTASLGNDFMKQVAKNLTDPFDGFLKDKKYVLMDRDSNFSCAFRTILDDASVKPMRLPPKSPNLNSHLERFHLSLKSEVLDRMILFGEESLRRATISFIQHYNEERNHQGLGNKIIAPEEEVGAIAGKIECRERLGGILKYYHRDVA